MLSTPCECVQILTDISPFVENYLGKNDESITITHSKLPASTKTTPANHDPKILQQQHLNNNTSTNPDGCHMSNGIHQNEINMTNEPLKTNYDGNCASMINFQAVTM